MTEKTMIRDLVKVPEVRTVVQLADITDPSLRDFLTESFLLTDEVKGILTSFFNDIVREEGKGYFIKGNFGSGKSHLLSVLSLLLTYQESWQPIIEQIETGGRLDRLREDIINEDYIVLNISLVEHSNKEYLEDIVIEEITDFLKSDETEFDFNFSGETEFTERIAELIREEYPNRLQSFLRENSLTEDELFSGNNLFLLEKLLERLNLPYRFNYNRQDIFTRLEELLDNTGYKGIIILVDELSEFLRSKPDGRRFNEDIRFLQFLGEFTNRVPCWVAATLQEEIEKTGENTPEAFNKIKDRYPNRFNLTGAHIKEIISHRLIRLKDGAEEQIEDIYNSYCKAFNDWSVSQDEFISLYPVHPLAVELLNNLKPLFSQHRGIIDFIHYRLKGDESRQIEGMMDHSPDRILTPDYIFDHFTERIREMMETNPYYEKVYRYYEQEIEALLGADEAEVGLRVVKLLILSAISPIDRQFTVRDIAHMLLYQITDLESGVNYDYISDILDRLYHHGAYLVREEGEKNWQTKYYIDLKADVNLIIKRKKEYIKSNLFADDSRLFSRLGREVEASVLPLAKLFDNPKKKEKVYWQNTAREGFVYFISLDDISIDNIKDSAGRFLTQEEDFMFFIGKAHRVDKQLDYLQEVLLPELSDQERKAFLFWLPRGLEEKEFLKDALSHLLLYDQYKDDSSATGREVRDHLEDRISEDRDKINRIFRQAYYEGKIINGLGKEMVSLDKSSFLQFDRIIDQAVSQLLRLRFPDHQKVNPYQQVLTSRQIDDLIEQFLAPGEITDLKQVDGRVMNVIDAFLKPMGLIKKQKKSIRLKISPDKNPLIKRFFSHMTEEKSEISEIYLKMRKGSYGLSRKQFKLLVYCLLYSGYLTAYSDKQKISLTHLNGSNFGRIKYLGYGEIIGEEFQRILSDCALLPPRFKKQTFSLPLQQEIWDHLTDKKRELISKIDRLKQRCQRLKREDDYLPAADMLDSLNNVDELLSEIKVSYSSEEGLERFASDYRSRPNVESYLENIKLIEQFIDEKLSDYRKIKDYLQDRRLQIPDDDRYQELNDLKDKLLNSFKSDSVVFKEDYFAELKDQFHKFQNKYIDLYHEDHHRQLAQDRFKPYEKIKKSRSYQVLSLLAGIKIISVKDDLVKVDRKLSQALRKRCNSLSVSRLKERPVCECNYNLGEKIELPSRKDIQQMIKSGIYQYLENLQEGKYRDKLEEYLDSMEAVGKKRFARPIRKIISISDSGNKENILIELEKNLNRRVISRINQALSSDISIVERDIDTLYENLVGRSFSPEQLQQLFDEWLKGNSGISNKTYIKVSSAAEEERTREEESVDRAELESYLKQYYPELLPLADIAGLQGISLFLALLSWEKAFELEWEDVEEIMRDFLPQRGKKILERLESDRSLQDSLYQLSDEVFQIKLDGSTSSGLKSLITSEIDRILLEENLKETVFTKIYPNDLADWLEVLQKEKVSTELLKYLTIQFVKQLENDNLDYNALQAGRCKEIIKEIWQEIKQGEAGSNHQSQMRYPNSDYDNDIPTNNDYYKKRIAVLEFAVDYLKLIVNKRYLEDISQPDSAKDWLKVYRGKLADLEYLLQRVAILSEEIDIREQIPYSLKSKKIERLIKQYNNRFSDFYESSQFLMTERSNTDQGMEDLRYLINEKYPEILADMKADKGICLMLDGMRWDLWKLIREQIIDLLPFRKIKEDSLFALEPTNTERQLTTLKESNFSGEIFEAEDVDPAKCLSNKREGVDLIKFSYIDDKVHSSKEHYDNFIREVLFQTENRLIPFLEKIPQSTPVLIFADHGFRINSQFREENKYESPRYLHGGNTPAEVIVPWSLLYRI